MKTARPRKLNGSEVVASLLALCLASLGCVSVLTPEPIPPGEIPRLGPDEGLVVVQIDIDVAVAELSLNRAVLARNLPKGEHLWLVRLPAGDYEWKSVKLGHESGRRTTYFVADISIDDQTVDPRDEFEFTVEAGKINYPGSAILRTSDFGRSSGLPVLFRVRNHAAMAIRGLRERSPAVLDAFPVRYAGLRGDTFLEHFEAVRRRLEEGGRVQ